MSLLPRAPLPRSLVASRTLAGANPRNASSTHWTPDRQNLRRRVRGLPRRSGPCVTRRSVSCITRTVVNVSGGYEATDRVHALALGTGERVRLQGDARLHLSLSQRYRIVEATDELGPWRVTTAGYFYEVADSDEREIVAFQWHPAGPSSVTTPHLHFGAGARIGYRTLAACHVPTGRISIEQVLRLAIE